MSLQELFESCSQTSYNTPKISHRFVSRLSGQNRTLLNYWCTRNILLWFSVKICSTFRATGCDTWIFNLPPFNQSYHIYFYLKKKTVENMKEIIWSGARKIIVCGNNSSLVEGVLRDFDRYICRTRTCSTDVNVSPLSYLFYLVLTTGSPK